MLPVALIYSAHSTCQDTKTTTKGKHRAGPAKAGGQHSSLTGSLTLPAAAVDIFAVLQ